MRFFSDLDSRPSFNDPATDWIFSKHTDIRSHRFDCRGHSRREDVSKRTPSARHFRKTDGSWTAVIGRNLNYADGTGKLLPVIVEFRPDDIRRVGDGCRALDRKSSKEG